MQEFLDREKRRGWLIGVGTTESKDKTSTIGGNLSAGETIASGGKNMVAVATLVVSSRNEFRITENSLDTEDAWVSADTSWGSGVEADHCFGQWTMANVVNAKEHYAFHWQICCSWVSHHSSGVSSGCGGWVEAVHFGGRNTGLCFTDQYSKGPEMSGVLTEDWGGAAHVKVDYSAGSDAPPDTAMAGGITNASSVVVWVEGIMATHNVVKELYTADSVNPPNSTGVKTCGVGMDATWAWGAQNSYGISHMATFDQTEMGMSTTVVVVIWGDAATYGRTFIYTEVSIVKSPETGAWAMENDDSTWACFQGAQWVANAKMQAHFGPFIDSQQFTILSSRTVNGALIASEITPECCPTYSDESWCTGVYTKSTDYLITSTEGAWESHGVFAIAIDSWVGVVSTAVGSTVKGAMETHEILHTDCGHECTEEKSCLSGVDTCWEKSSRAIYPNLLGWGGTQLA